MQLQTVDWNAYIRSQLHSISDMPLLFYYYYYFEDHCFLV
jgi:hypothetical protein